MLSQHALQVVFQHALLEVSRVGLLLGGAWSGGVPGPWGVPHSGGSAPGGMPCGDPLPPSPGDGYCCGRYASYWNAFLFDL